jgi:hypothetical protein
VTRRLSPWQALLGGALTVGVLDILDAFVFFGLRGVSPIRILQSIAGGLLGRAAFQGGLATAVLGLVLHFTIAFLIVGTYYVASGRLGALVRHAIPCGMAFGVAAYLVMNFVVVPLSAAGGASRTLPVVLNGLCIHIVGVGLPAALFAKAARRNDQ